MSKWPRQVAHAIYWKLHKSYLTNNRKEAEKFLGMLVEYSDSQIEKEITPPHFQRFLKIRENISGQQFGRLYGNGYDVPSLPVNFAPVQKSCEEKEFCKKLNTKEGREKLLSLLLPVLKDSHENFETHSITQDFILLNEYELGHYGRLDFYGKSGRTVFAIECKVGLAPNSLVSQIDRYRLALELDMNLGATDEIKAYVLSERFTTYEAIELSRMAVNMIEHSGTIESLKLL